MGKPLRIIGDIHGKIEQYQHLTACDRPTIQVGDFGAGFVDMPVLDGKDRFIRGNHDDPAICASHPNWIRDGLYEDDILFIGGAWSIDWQRRIPGVSWWEDEELSYKELHHIIEKACDLKPKVIISHDAPDVVIEAGGFRGLNGKKTPRIPTRTSSALEDIYRSVPPSVWFFGHWHQTMAVPVGTTSFFCLGELAYCDFDLDDVQEPWSRLRPQ